VTAIGRACARAEAASYAEWRDAVDGWDAAHALTQKGAVQGGEVQRAAQHTGYLSQHVAAIAPIASLLSQPVHGSIYALCSVVVALDSSCCCPNEIVVDVTYSY
jgi:hypothetical protein